MRGYFSHIKVLFANSTNLFILQIFGKSRHLILISIIPGILRFHQVSLVEEADDNDNSLPDISPDDLHTNTGKLTMNYLFTNCQKNSFDR